MPMKTPGFPYRMYERMPPFHCRKPIGNNISSLPKGQNMGLLSPPLPPPPPSRTCRGMAKLECQLSLKASESSHTTLTGAGLSSVRLHQGRTQPGREKRPPAVEGTRKRGKLFFSISGELKRSDSSDRSSPPSPPPCLPSSG